MTLPIQYIINEKGERVGVLMDWNTYSNLSASPNVDKDLLVGLSPSELNALASCKLAVTEQSRLDELLARNSESLLSNDEQLELDELLAKADQLTIIKTRARYTLHHISKDPTAA